MTPAASTWAAMSEVTGRGDAANPQRVAPPVILLTFTSGRLLGLCRLRSMARVAGSLFSGCAAGLAWLRHDICRRFRDICRRSRRAGQLHQLQPAWHAPPRTAKATAAVCDHERVAAALRAAGLALLEVSEALSRRP